MVLGCVNRRHWQPDQTICNILYAGTGNFVYKLKKKTAFICNRDSFFLTSECKTAATHCLKNYRLCRKYI